MYFAGKLVYLIVLPSNQLAITLTLLFSVDTVSYVHLKIKQTSLMSHASWGGALKVLSIVTVYMHLGISVSQKKHPSLWHYAIGAQQKFFTTCSLLLLQMFNMMNNYIYIYCYFTKSCAHPFNWKLNACSPSYSAVSLLLIVKRIVIVLYIEKENPRLMHHLLISYSCKITSFNCYLNLKLRQKPECMKYKKLLFYLLLIYFSSGRI